MAICDVEKEEFENVINALKYKQVALVQSSRKLNGKTVRALVLCSVEKDRDGVEVTPLAEMITDKMFDEYAEPSTDLDSVQDGQQIHELPTPPVHDVESLDRGMRLINSMNHLGGNVKRVLQIANFSDRLVEVAVKNAKEPFLKLDPEETITGLMLAALSIAKTCELDNGVPSIVEAATRANDGADPLWDKTKKLSKVLSEWITEWTKKSPS